MLGTLWVIFKVLLASALAILLVKELLTFYYVSLHKNS